MANLQSVRVLIGEKDALYQADAAGAVLQTVHKPSLVKKDAKGVRVCVLLAGLLTTKYRPPLATHEADVDMGDPEESQSPVHVQASDIFKQMVASLPDRLVTGKATACTHCLKSKKPRVEQLLLLGVLPALKVL